ncbi:glycogen/starch/alpha-glucan phosphorylase, partial [Marinobacter sp. 71-i]
EPEVADLQTRGYHPIDFVRADENLSRALDLVSSGAFSGGDGSVFEPVVSNLIHHDPFMALADYTDYIAAQKRVDALYADQDAWTRAAIL